MKIFAKKSIFIIVFLMMPNFVLAASIISSVSGTIQNSQTVAISGSGFGLEGPLVVSWDNFDSKTVGNTVHNTAPIVGPNWTLQHPSYPETFEADNTRAHSGAVSVKADWSTDPNAEGGFGWAGRGPYSELYITYWRYMTGDFVASTCNHKQWYLFGNGTYGGYSDMPQAMPLIPAGNSKWGYYNNVSSPAQPNYDGTNNMNDNSTYGLGDATTYTWANTSNAWNRWEFYQKLNTDYSCTVGSNCDGVVEYWIDGVKTFSRSDYKHRYATGSWDDFRLGHMVHGFSSTARAWFDDIYIATKKARIEIGDAAVFDNCTHREIQIPSTWNNTDITFTANQGSFSNGQAYLFVIDENGDSSAGYPVTFSSGSSDTISPSNPTGLSVS